MRPEARAPRGPGRQATSWTLPLRRATTAYLLLAAVVELVTNALFVTRQAIERSLRASNPGLGGAQLRESVTVGYIGAWLVVTVIVAGAAVLAFGAHRGWRWVFWVNLGVMLVGAAQVVTNAVALTNPATQVQPPAAIAVDLVLSLLALALLVWSVAAATRYGPWAMRRTGAGR